MKNLILVLFLLPLRSFSQDLSGVWTGTLYNDTTRNTTAYQIAVSEKNGKYAAYSYAVFKTETKEVYGIKTLEIVRSRDKIFFRDKELIEDNYPADAPAGIKQITAIKLFDSLGKKFMSGTFITTRSGKYGRPVTGSILLVKENENLEDVTLIKRIIKQNLAPTLAFLTVDDLKKKRTTSDVSADAIAKTELPTTVKLNEKSLTENVSAQQKTIAGSASDSLFVTNRQPEKKELNTPSKTEPLLTVKAFDNTSTVQISKAENKSADPATVSSTIIPSKTENKTLSAAEDVRKKNELTALANEKKPAAVKEETVQKKQPKQQEDQNTSSIAANASGAVQTKQLTKEQVKVPQDDVALNKTQSETVVKKNVEQPVEKKPVQEPVVVKEQPKKSEPLMSVNAPEKGSDNSKLKLPTVSITEQLASRKIENIQTVEFVNDSLRLELYDNGTIDGDSVSVIVNGEVVMQHQLLSSKAITKTVHATGDSLKIVMFAENLGSIAPNTGLLIVYDGQKRYEITFSGDLQKNSAILFKRRR